MNETYRILFLENDHEIANQARNNLESQGYRVDLCAHEGCFIEQIEREFYDLFVIDYISSGANGLEFLKKLCVQKDLPPATMVFASKDIEITVETMKMGCADYVIKELGDYLDLLTVSIKNILEKQGLKRAKDWAETSLLVAPANLQRAQKLAKIGIWEYYPDENVAYWSKQEFRNFGYDREINGVKYNEYIDRIHPDDRKMVEEKNAICLELKQPVEFDFRLVLDDGKIRYIHSRTEVDLDSDQQVIRMFGISQDVTEQKLTERRLREVAAVFETTTEAIFIADKKNKITSNYNNVRIYNPGKL